MIENQTHDEVLLVNEYEDVHECPVCNCKDRHIYIKHRNYQLLKCKKCSLIYQTPRKKHALLDNQYVENVSSRSEYYESAFIYDKACFKERLLRVVKTLNFNPEGKHILDIGCNIGSFMSAAKELGFKAMGVEPNPSAAKYCLDRDYNVINSFFSKEILAGKENYFDIIHLGDITEHVTDPLDLIKTVKEFTKPGGYILISTPNINSVVARTFQIKPNEHIFYFSEESLVYLILHAGFFHVKTLITSRKRNFKSFSYSTSFKSKKNKLILDLVTIFGIGELTTELLKYFANDEIFLIGRKPVD